MPKHDSFSSIASSDLDRVAGGASRVSSRTGGSNEQLTQMLTQITSSIKDLAGSKSSGMDPMMMMMMMMGGGGGGGGGAVAAPAPAPAPTPAINISVKSNG
jgi:phage-related minor tail protein